MQNAGRPEVLLSPSAIPCVSAGTTAMSLNNKLKKRQALACRFSNGYSKKSAPVTAHHELELTAARHRVVAVLCNDAVVDQRDVERSKPRDKHLCSSNVLA